LDCFPAAGLLSEKESVSVSFNIFRPHMFLSGSESFQNIKRFFNNRHITTLCLLLAILNKSLIAWLYSDLEADKALYLLFAKSFLATGVLAEPLRIFESGVTTYVYNPGVISPVYSLLSLPFLWLTQSYFTTQLLISILGWSLFFGALYKIAQVSLKERWLISIFILCTGFFLYPHELVSGPKDTLATAFTLWSVYFAWKFIQKPGFVYTLLLSLSLCLMAGTKYLYAPLSVLFFLVILFFVVKKSQAHRYQLALLLLVFGILAFSMYYCFIQPSRWLANQQPVNLINDGTRFIRGFYPQNLLYSFPFITSSLLNTNFLGVQVEHIFRIPFSQATHLFQLLDLLLLLTLAGFFILRFKQVRTNAVTVLLLVTAMALAGQVFFLSLSFQAFSYKTSSHLWTYVSDARSFFFPMLCLQLLLFFLSFRTKVLPQGIKTFLILLFAFECMHGVYFTVKQTVHAKEVMLVNNTNSPVKKITNVISRLAARDKNLSLVTSDNTLRRYALVNNQTSYALTQQSPRLSWIPSGSSFVIVTPAADSGLVRSLLPMEKLRTVDTIAPFILQLYQP
jgi:hypothetical protein